MAARYGFVAYLIDQLAPLGDVVAKSMFGGYGIYCDQAMFGIVADDEFFLKVDEKSRGEFEREGLSPFIYAKNGKEVAMSFYRAPPEAIDDSEVMLAWAKKGHSAAVRAAATKGKRPRTRRRRKP